MPKPKKTPTAVKTAKQAEKTVKDLSARGKLAMMAVRLTREDGATLKQLAEEFRWKENSVRGAISTLSKSQKDSGFNLISEKQDGIRKYRLVPISE